MVAILMFLFHFLLVLYLRNNVVADTMNVYPMDTYISNISCYNSTVIKISKINVIYEEKLNFCTDQKCQLDKEDSSSIQDNCNGRQSCSFLTNFSSQCLYRRKHVNISYTCKAPTDLKCNFESSDACNWKLDATLPVDFSDWIKTNGGDGEEQLNDHTTGKDFGYYAIMRSEGRATYAYLVSDPIVSENKLCLTFWYVGKGVYVFSVSYLYNETDSPHEIHTISNPNTDSWTKTSVDIDVNGSINILIKGILSSSGQYIAIDDIDVLNGSCNDRVRLTVNTKTTGLDTFKTVDTFEYEGYGNWKVQKSTNLTLSTECGTDHTTDYSDGKCVVISAKEGSDGNLLLVRNLNATKFERFCLQLWHNSAQLKENEATIDIYLKENSKEHLLMETFVLPPTNSTQDVAWKMLSLNIHNSYPCHLVIKIRLPPSNNLRYIGIDDIMLQNSECPGTKYFTDDCVNIDSPITLNKCPFQYISDISMDYGQTNSAATSCPKETVKNYISAMCENTNSIYCTFMFPENGNSCLSVERNLSINYECTTDDQSDEKESSTSVVDVSDGPSSRNSTTVVNEDVQLDDKESNIIAAVVGVIGGTVLILVIALVVYAIRRKRNKADDKVKESGVLIRTCHDQSAINGGRDQVTHYNSVYVDQEPNQIKKGNNDDAYDTANNTLAKTDDNNEHVYDRNTDGVYDTSTHTKQKDHDTGIYGRTTDDVYDTSNNTRRRQDDDVNIYDTNTNGDGVYDTSSNSRRTDNDLNIYGRSVNSVYDVSDNCKRENVPDQTYDHLPQ